MTEKKRKRSQNPVNDVDQPDEKKAKRGDKEKKDKMTREKKGEQCPLEKPDSISHGDTKEPKSANIGEEREKEKRKKDKSEKRMKEKKAKDQDKATGKERTPEGSPFKAGEEVQASTSENTKDRKTKKEKSKEVSVDPSESVMGEKKEKKKEKREKKEKDIFKNNRHIEEAEGQDTTSSYFTVDAEPTPIPLEILNGTPKTGGNHSQRHRGETRKSDVPQENEEQKKDRFIVFIGNLPYTANQESLANHFQKIEPISIRVATQRDDNNKCRGFAFIEFENFDRMQTCLKLYHHSTFEDGKSPARRINAELTAGGGGKSQTRKAKLEVKNQKLSEERGRMSKEQKQKTNKNNTKPQTNAREEPPSLNHRYAATASAIAVNSGNDDLADVHPSRRGQIPGGSG